MKGFFDKFAHVAIKEMARIVIIKDKNEPVSIYECII